MRRKLLYLLAFVAIAAAAYILLQRDFDRQLFLESFGRLRPVWILASVAALFLGYLLRAIRWRFLLHSLKPIEVGPLLAGTILGFAAIYTLGRAGEFLRPVWIARRAGIPVAGSFAAIAVERVFDLLMMLLLAAATLTVADLPVGAALTVGRMRPVIWLLLGAGAAALVVFTWLARRSGAIRERFPAVLPWTRMADLCGPFLMGLGAASGLRSQTVIALTSLLVWLSIALQFWLMLVGMNFDLDFGGAILILAITAVGSLIQIPGIGGGFQAAFAFSLTGIFMIPAETAIAAALLAWIFSYAPTLAASAGYMMWKGVSPTELAPEKAASSSPT